MARSTRLTTGIRSAPTTEMYTRCGAPARDAARTRFRALSSSPLLLPAQCTMISAPSTAASIPSPVARSPVTNVDALAGLAAAPAEHPHLAAGVPQPRDDEAPERARAAGDQDRAAFVIAPCGAAHGLLSAGSAVARMPARWRAGARLS